MTPKAPDKTTQITKVELPEWVDKASQKNYSEAEAIGNQPFIQYAGPRVADMNSNTKGMIESLKGQIGSGDMTGILGDIASGKTSIANTDMSKYMNPYTSEVIDKSMADMDRGRLTALMGNSDAAQKAGAFGGSRHGIIDAVTNAESIKDQGLMASQLRSSGWDKALGSAQQDISNSASAAQGTIDSRTKNLAALMQTGLMEKSQGQQGIDSEIDKFNEPRNRQIENMNLKLSALGMSPYGKTENTNKETTGGSSGTDWAQAGLGIFSMLLGLSDDNTKTDKEKVGKLPGTDLDMWAFRYKTDPKTYPKSVGVMASDVEKKMPEAVHRIGKRRVINYGLIAEVMGNGN